MIIKYLDICDFFLNEMLIFALLIHRDFIILDSATKRALKRAYPF